MGWSSFFNVLYVACKIESGPPRIVPFFRVCVISATICLSLCRVILNHQLALAPKISIRILFLFYYLGMEWEPS